MTKEKACIICGEKTKKGYAVIEDKIIEIIRSIKSKFGAVKGYELYVCEGCLEPYEKKRKRFERNILLYGGLGLFIAIVLLFFNFSISSLLLGIFMFALMILLAIMNYVPRIEKKKEVKKDEKGKGKRKPRKKE